MGDAGPLPPNTVQEENNIITPGQSSSAQAQREINVLVTGFGPFKAFTTNPSFLITSGLPACLDLSCLPQKWELSPNRQPNASPDSQPYRINIHAYPTPVKVAYGSTATSIPRLIAWHQVPPQGGPPSTTTSYSVDPTSGHRNYDYVLHIGMAGGRDNYSLETIAHRDHYKIKDVDDRDGFMAGEYQWKQEGLPEHFSVGWHKEEVLSRWECLVAKAEDEYEAAQMAGIGFSIDQSADAGFEAMRDKYRSLAMIGKGKRAIVKLSKDAGRFLCEFILYTSLSTRFKEAANGSRVVDQHQTSSSRQSSANGHPDEPPAQRIGKVAFLHVPGAVGEHDIARGVRVAEAAILALVSSWEDGYRNSEMYNIT